MTADFTPEQAATLARFEAAEDAPESLRGRIANLLWDHVSWEDAERLTDRIVRIVNGEAAL